jgi:wyosine [tRNA(Phe)-imidazoG37] synthetase (radical SAM superfamily)
MLKYIYGPVPSRRLGFSLGVDVIPYKVCTLDCVYCQLGSTTQKVIERKPYFEADDVLEELRDFLAKKPHMDFITFSGSGEPTLNSEIGVMIKKLKDMSSVPVAVLTNGTLLSREDVRKDLIEADVILPSLDAVSQKVFKRINRPHEFLEITTIINGLKNFRDMFKGQIWLEIMLVKGINDNTDELSRIKESLHQIRPDKVHLNTVIRPPSEIYAEALNHAEMTAVKNFLGEGCEVIAEFMGKSEEEAEDAETTIVEMAKRRPVTAVDIANVIGISESNAERMAESLTARKRLKEKRYREKKYYTFAKEP